MSTVERPPAAAQPRPAPPAGRGPLVAGALTLLLVCTAGFVALAYAAVLTRPGQQADQQAMDSVDGPSATVQRLLDLLGTVSIGTAAAGLGLCVVLALLRQRYAHALAAIALVAGANVTTQVVKRIALERPDLGVGYDIPNSLPSGHTTVVASLVLAALLVAPRALRLPFAALGTIAIVVTGAATVVADWHRPSDVLTALLVAPAWGALVVLVLGWQERAPAPGRGGGVAHLGLSVGGAALAGALLIGVGVRPDDGWADVTTAAWTLGAIGLAAAVTTTVFARFTARHLS